MGGNVIVSNIYTQRITIASRVLRAILLVNTPTSVFVLRGVVVPVAPIKSDHPEISAFGLEGSSV